MHGTLAPEGTERGWQDSGVRVLARTAFHRCGHLPTPAPLLVSALPRTSNRLAVAGALKGRVLRGAR